LYSGTSDAFKVAGVFTRHAAGRGAFTLDVFLDIAREFIPALDLDRLWRVFYCLPESLQMEAWDNLIEGLPEHCREKAAEYEAQERAEVEYSFMIRSAPNDDVSF
jgi:hypothetical protein